MINAIGLENPGVDAFVAGLGDLARLRQPVIVSVGGNSPDQYAAVVERIEAGARGGRRPGCAGRRRLRAQRLVPERARRPVDRRRPRRDRGRHRSRSRGHPPSGHRQAHAERDGRAADRPRRRRGGRGRPLVGQHLPGDGPRPADACSRSSATAPVGSAAPRSSRSPCAWSRSSRRRCPARRWWAWAA